MSWAFRNGWAVLFSSIMVAAAVILAASINTTVIRGSSAESVTPAPYHIKCYSGGGVILDTAADDYARYTPYIWWKLDGVEHQINADCITEERNPQ